MSVPYTECPWARLTRTTVPGGSFCMYSTSALRLAALCCATDIGAICVPAVVHPDAAIAAQMTRHIVCLTSFDMAIALSEIESESDPKHRFFEAPAKRDAQVVTEERTIGDIGLVASGQKRVHLEGRLGVVAPD